MTEFGKRFEENFTYLRAFERSVERFPRRPALTCMTWGRSWTYAELDAETNRLASGLRALGVGRGDVVMCLLYNTADFVLFWVGLQKLAAVFSPINFHLASGEIAAHVEDSLPKVLVYDGGLAEVTDQALRLASHQPDVVVVAGSGKALPGALAFSELGAGRSDAPVRPEFMGPLDEIVRLYTSGTTGEPKGVPLNNAANLLRSYDVLMHFPLGPLDKTLNMTPWFHSGGLHSGGPCPTLHAGGEIVAMKAFNPRHVLDAVERYGLTFLIGAPVSLELLYQVQSRQPRDLSSLKGIVTMGAFLEKDACLRYHKVLTPTIFNGYGTTETFWNTFLRPQDLPAKAGSAGRSCTDDDVRVVVIDPARAHSEPEEMVPRDGASEGEIIIRTLKAPYAYHNKPEETRRSYYKGWYYTRDVGSWDAEGYLTVIGRRDDMVVSAGENIHPAQVEAIINEFPGVQDSVVVGVPDGKRGRVLAAYVVPVEEGLDLHELFVFLTNHPRLANFKRPRYFKIVDSLPMTATGKKKHFEATQWAERDWEQRAFLML